MSHHLRIGDALEQLRLIPSGSVHCCITSPPYWGLRDYNVAGQIGLESSLDDFLQRLVAVFTEVRRVLRDDGTCWVNMGDSYVTSANTGTGWNSQINGKRTQIESGRASRAVRRTKISTGGLKQKDLIGQPWLLAFALRASGWWLRQDIIWHKPNPMPETVSDRCTRAHEYLFLLTKGQHYHFDAGAIATPIKPKTLTVRTAPTKGDGTGSAGEKVNAWMAANGGRKHPQTANRRTVWSISARPFPGAHFATFPDELVEPCVLAGCPRGGGSSRPIHRQRNDRRCRSTPRPVLPGHRTEPGVRSHGP